jgi:hypothetical protein
MPTRFHWETFLWASGVTLWEITSVWVPGGVWSQGWNLKELTEKHHKEWILRLNLTQHGETYRVQTWWGLTDWELFLDSMGGGAWPFLVGGVICLVDSDNERDLNLLVAGATERLCAAFTRTISDKLMEAWGKNRSVMPFDDAGRTRDTIIWATSKSHGGKPAWWLVPKGMSNLWNHIVLGIDHWNYWSWTRNS